MYKEITDKQFVNEMKILWQNSQNRNKFGNIIRKYFDCGDRSEKIINKMQESI